MLLCMCKPMSTITHSLSHVNICLCAFIVNTHMHACLVLHKCLYGLTWSLFLALLLPWFATVIPGVVLLTPFDVTFCRDMMQPLISHIPYMAVQGNVWHFSPHCCCPFVPMAFNWSCLHCMQLHSCSQLICFSYGMSMPPASASALVHMPSSLPPSPPGGP